MLKRARFTLVTTLVAAALVLLPLYLREPRYQGRPVRAWIQDCSSPKPQVVTAASNALHQLGPRWFQRSGE
jgi:hypothetical protein